MSQEGILLVEYLCSAAGLYYVYVLFLECPPTLSKPRLKILLHVVWSYCLNRKFIKGPLFYYSFFVFVFP